MNPQQYEHSNKLIALLPEVAKVGMQSFDRLITLAQCAFDVQSLQGDVCEFGCNAGGTARWLRELLPDKYLWLYDTFSGQPSDDVSFSKGAMAAPRSCVEDIPKSTIVEGNILNLSQASSNVPQRIILAHIDLDTHEGTLHTLNLVWPRLVPHGCIIIDDFHDEAFPGVKKAVDEFSISIPHLKIQSAYGCAGKNRASVVMQTPVARKTDRLLRAINGALKDTINSHGPITKDNYGSAGKRTAGLLAAHEE